MTKFGLLSEERRQLLLHDFYREIERVDRIVFGDRGLSSASAFPAAACGSEWGEMARIGSFVSLFATYLSGVTPLHKGDADKNAALHSAVNSSSNPQLFERYAVWTTPVSNWLNTIFVGGFDHKGEADAEVKERWLLFAYAIVRVRVLMHGDWFPQVQLRTKENIIHHRALFADQYGDEISGARRLRELSLAAAEKLHDPMLLDVHWTLELVVHALFWGVPEVSALGLMYSDKY